MVSGTISLPSRGAFHLSLTVLVHYRWQRVFSLRRWSSQIPTRFLVSRGTWAPASESHAVPPTGLSPSMAGCSKTVRLQLRFVTPIRIQGTDKQVPQPHNRNAPALSHDCSLGSSRFARRYSGNHSCFLFLGLLRCFSSPGALQLAYVFNQR